MPQVELTAAAVCEAMKRAAIVDAADVHWVQVKCPLYAGGNVTPVAPHVAGFVAQILDRRHRADI